MRWHVWFPFQFCLVQKSWSGGPGLKLKVSKDQLPHRQLFPGERFPTIVFSGGNCWTSEKVFCRFDGIWWDHGCHGLKDPCWDFIIERFAQKKEGKSSIGWLKKLGHLWPRLPPTSQATKNNSKWHWRRVVKLPGFIGHCYLSLDNPKVVTDIFKCLLFTAWKLLMSMMGGPIWQARVLGACTLEPLKCWDRYSTQTYEAFSNTHMMDACDFTSQI